MVGLALSICGTCGKGMLCMYPSLGVPTHPFRVLGLTAHGSSTGNFSCGESMVTLRYDVPWGDVYSGNWQGFLDRATI